MIRIALVLFLVQFLKIDSCTTVEAESLKADAASLSGEWVLKSVFLGDVIDTPCGWEAKDPKQMTLNITTTAVENDSKSFILNGQSAVNQFFGSYAIQSFDKTTKRGTIKMGAIGGTKMAGPEAMMNCETRYYTLLGDAVDFQLVEGENGPVLHLGRLKKDNTPSRDGGTYLIFEKGK